MPRIQYRVVRTEKFHSATAETFSLPCTGKVSEDFSVIEAERYALHDAHVNFYGGADGNEVIRTVYRYRPVWIEARAWSQEPWPWV